MIRYRTLLLLSFLVLACGYLPAADTPTLSARVVHYGEKDVVAVKAKIRYTTLIVLPKQESILDYTCGDKEFYTDGKATYIRANRCFRPTLRSPTAKTS